MKYYLAYGSNLNKEQMAWRCPEAEAVGSTVLFDYELVFRRGVLTIEPKKGASVPVGIWKITDSDEKALDRYEGYPRFYFKKTLKLQLPQVKEAMAYIMTKGYPIQAPSDGYFFTVYRGYKDFGMATEPLIDAYEKAKRGDGR